MRKGLQVGVVAPVVAVIAALGGASVPRADSAVTSAFVRVNQVGYPTGAAKRAYLMSSVAETGATFTVRNQSGATLLTGQVGASLGSWSRVYSFVYPLDFDGLTTPGTYTVDVTGPVGASSPSFKVDTGPNV
jgi:endoglucanase